MSELRWNRMLGQWVATATHRQERTFLPPATSCPLCPTRPGGFASEVPAEEYEIVVFENRFPSLRTPPPEPSLSSHGLFEVAPAAGECEVILYTQEHDLTFAGLTQRRVEHVIEVWTERTNVLGARAEIEYVFIFENKGEAVGVTLHHPHGQIYAYPFVPAVIQTELTQFLKYTANNASCLLCDLVAEEVAFGSRIVAENDSFVAYVPFAARWPYEVHLVSKRHYGGLADFRKHEISACAEMLLRITRAYDALFNVSFPYVMALHQQPSKRSDDAYHFHVEFYPPMRSEQRLKYLAGSELGAGMFINDALPEETAVALRRACERIWTL